MIVVPFENWHWDFFSPAWPIFKNGVDFERAGCSYTLTEAGELYGVFGGVPLWKGVIETFLIPGDNFAERKLSCIKAIKRHEEMARSALGLWREQTTVPVNNHVAIRWLEFLGYEQEGVLRKFGPDGQDHYRYARLYDGH